MGDNYQIQRDDGVKDGIAGQVFASYDEAYAVVERYYADICCSDDREFYRIVPVAMPSPCLPQAAALDGAMRNVGSMSGNRMVAVTNPGAD